MAEQVEIPEEHAEATTLPSAEAPGSGISIRIIGAVSIAIALVLAFYAFALAGQITDANDAAEVSEQSYLACSSAIDDLQSASDYLTSQVRMFVVTGDREAMEAYFEELNVTNRRGQAVETLKKHFSDDLEATADLQSALDASDALAEDEFVAMRLAAQYYGIDELPYKVESAPAIEGEQGMTSEELLEAAQEIMLGEDYADAKETISANVQASSDALLEELGRELEGNETAMLNLLFQLRVSVALLLCVVMVLVLVVLMYILKPLNHYIKRIQKNEPLEASGSHELRYLANAYNVIYEDNSKRLRQLREYAERDPLTGLSNRTGYNNFLATHTRNIALLLIDIDNFRDFNDVYGRDTGNAVMVKLAEALSTAFRSTDFPCHIESDLFAVVMTSMNAGLHDAVSNKIGLVNSILADDSDDLPLVTLSVGAAFSTEGMTDQDIYAAAESALHQAQDAGRNQIVFYGEGNAPSGE